MARQRGAQDAALAALACGAVACNNARLEASGERIGDPREIALMLTGAALGARTDAEERARDRLALYHFEPHLKLISTADRVGAERWLHTKGAPEAVLARCNAVLGPAGERIRLDEPRRDTVVSTQRGLAGTFRVGYAVWVAPYIDGGNG